MLGLIIEGKKTFQSSILEDSDEDELVGAYTQQLKGRKTPEQGRQTPVKSQGAKTPTPTKGMAASKLNNSQRAIQSLRGGVAFFCVAGSRV